MNEDQLRTIVREAIAQHASTTHRPPVQPSMTTVRLHASHGMFSLLSDGSSGDGPCIIEPAVMCNHCGYCKSFGH